MLDFLEGFNAVSIDLAKIVKIVLQVEVFGSLEDFWSDVVSKVVKHNVSVQFALLG